MIFLHGTPTAVLNSLARPVMSVASLVAPSVTPVGPFAITTSSRLCSSTKTQQYHATLYQTHQHKMYGSSHSCNHSTNFAQYTAHNADLHRAGVSRSRSPTNTNSGCCSSAHQHTKHSRRATNIIKSKCSSSHSINHRTTLRQQATRAADVDRAEVSPRPGLALAGSGPSLR